MGVIGETLLYSLLSVSGTPITDVRSQKEWQTKGVDFIWNGLKMDAKFDTQTPRTKNIALETISVRKGEEIVKRGWIYESQADVIVYIYLWGESWKFVIFTPEEARNIILPEHKRSLVRNVNYTGEVVLVPESKFKRYCEVPLASSMDEANILVELMRKMV